MKITWKELKHELLAATSRDFERNVFPWLKLMTPELVLPSALKELDRKGVDIAFVTPGSIFPLVVQCKGFEVSVEELGSSQVGQVAGSVDSFINSGLKCKDYVLLFNRGGNNRSFATAAKQELDRLVANGCVKNAELWSLDDLVKRLNHDLTHKVMTALAHWSDRMERQRPRLFSFDDVVIHDVPAFKRLWTLQLGASVGVLQESQPLDATQVRDELVLRREGRYSLVIGSYGMGKTTMMRNFRLPSGFTRILVPASALAHIDNGGGSEHSLLEQLLRHTGCLVDLSDQTTIELKRLERIASRCLADALHSGQADTILVIDGLDENRIYSRPDGFLLLANELGKLRVPIVLTTRREHFYNSYQDLQPEQQKVWLSRSVSARVIELVEWSNVTCTAMIDRIASRSPQHRESLRKLEKHLTGGKLPLVFSHPLWLAMAIDLALGDNDSLFDAPAQLYSQWTEQKFRRDFSAPHRDIPTLLGNSAIFVRVMDTIMLQVAAKMCSLVDGALQLVEEIGEDEVDHLARALIKSDERLDPLYAQASLLTPTSIRTSRAPLRLRFSHYSFQEFYTARAIEEGLISRDVVIPAGVQAFLR
ncbi:NACHT domain-containing protein [Burkholderia diffusa]|uniref:NACHT domain-containing protein n=1 Tax=Burkholderia diffusa TaxID=488732 RepID=UPI0015826EAF|nr:hypothetical protein [Burkholderia diffusa]